MVKAWKRVLDRLAGEIRAEDIHLWLSPLQAQLDGNVLKLLAPNAIVLDKVKRNYLPRIEALVEHLEPALRSVQLEVGSSHGRSGTVSGEQRAVDKAEVPFESRLDPRYVFENFVEGSSNQLAKAAAMRVAQQPGQSSGNPLVLYGGTGLGKTHLLHAAGHLLQKLKPRARVLYVRSEDFVSQMVKALRSSSIDEFKVRYRNLDALLIDDIQFFAGKDRTQEEFFHTFNSLYDGKQQIILTCDRYPKDLESIEHRLKSRFGWGLSVAVEPPDYETRLAILLAKSQQIGLLLDDSVASYIAKRMHSNVRELEGALNNLQAHANFMREPVTLAFAQEALRDRLGAVEKSASVGNIQRTVAEFYRVNLSELLSQKRTRAIARARQVAMALAKELTDSSLKEIGQAFGGRDHTTVLHACRLVAEWQRNDSGFFEEWQGLLRRLIG
jgi:chromosomal replication initiator protein